MLTCSHPWTSRWPGSLWQSDERWDTHTPKMSLCCSSTAWQNLERPGRWTEGIPVGHRLWCYEGEKIHFSRIEPFPGILGGWSEEECSWGKRPLLSRTDSGYNVTGCLKLLLLGLSHRLYLHLWDRKKKIFSPFSCFFITTSGKVTKMAAYDVNRLFPVRTPVQVSFDIRDVFSSFDNNRPSSYWSCVVDHLHPREPQIRKEHIPRFTKFILQMNLMTPFCADVSCIQTGTWVCPCWQPTVGPVDWSLNWTNVRLRSPAAL